ncbi:MAG: carboxypeptidase-like regulatory domain-containing protein [Thermogutta sp.]
MRKSLLAAILTAAALLGPGCNLQPSVDYSKLDLVAGSGTVTLNGQPLPDAVVMFEDAENGTVCVGLTDAAGRYELRVDSRKKGVTAGRKIVRISTATRIPGLNVGFDGEGGDAEERGEQGSHAPPQELVPARYNKDSQLTVEVTASQKSYDFDLTSP